MTSYLTKDQFSKATRRLRAALVARGITVKHSKAQESLARLLGFNDLYHMRKSPVTPFVADAALAARSLEDRIAAQSSRLAAFLGIPLPDARHVVVEARPTGRAYEGRPRFVATEEDRANLHALVASGQAKMYPGGNK